MLSLKWKFTLKLISPNLLASTIQDQPIQPCKAKIATQTPSEAAPIRSPVAEAVCRRWTTIARKCLGSDVTHRVTIGLPLSAASSARSHTEKPLLTAQCGTGLQEKVCIAISSPQGQIGQTQTVDASRSRDLSPSLNFYCKICLQTSQCAWRHKMILVDSTGKTLNSPKSSIF